jgi:predicted adenine nucleotide alpha hydrolase (AANH) superfamily ATPase
VRRCQFCYRLRLEKTAEQAQKHGFEAFTTSLLISPFQDFEQIVSTGKELAEKYNTHFYIRDFRQHFREAMSHAQALGFYRQKYCGCIYSKKEKLEKSKKSKVKNQKQ